MAVAVDFLHRFGLIQGELLSTDGQLEPSYARSKGCTYACERCQAFPLDEAARQALGEPWRSGAKRLQITCPCPEVVAKVREATAKKGHQHDPTVPLLAIETGPRDTATPSQRQRMATLLDLPQEDVPPVPINWCHGRQGPSGALLGSCPTMPSDLEANVGHHVETTDPAHHEEIFGSVHLKTTDLNPQLGLECPLGNSTSPANVNEGRECVAHRMTLALPVRPGQVQLEDAASDVTGNYEWLQERGAMAVLDDNRRNEHVDEASLLRRGYDVNGTPYAPCGRLGRSNGSDDHAQSRQDVCGKPCPPKEQRHCPHRVGVLGSSHRMTCKDPPRLSGPLQRGPPAWQRLYGARSASERTNSDDQEVIAKAHPLRMRGLKAFRCAGAIRTLAQLVRRALHFVLDVTSTRSKSSVAQTCMTPFFDNRQTIPWIPITPVRRRGRVCLQTGLKTACSPPSNVTPHWKP